MTWDEMVELAARAWWGLANDSTDIFDGLSPHTRQTSLEQTRAALLALHAAGVRFMPEEATEEMQTAGEFEYHTLENPWPGGFTKGMRGAYTAMLAAGKIKPEDGK